MTFKLILNEELPPELRAQLDIDAEVEDIPVNDVAMRILCDAFDMEHPPSHAKYRPVAARFKLRVPEELHRRIRIEAANRNQYTVRGVSLSTLAAHYGIDGISPLRRPRKESP